MNWDQVEGQWKQVKGKLKSKWGKLTDDDITTLTGKKDELIGRIQTRYGMRKEDAEKQLDAWMKSI